MNQECKLKTGMEKLLLTGQIELLDDFYICEETRLYNVCLETGPADTQWVGKFRIKLGTWPHFTSVSFLLKALG